MRNVSLLFAFFVAFPCAAESIQTTCDGRVLKPNDPEVRAAVRAVLGREPQTEEEFCAAITGGEVPTPPPIPTDRLEVVNPVQIPEELKQEPTPETRF